MTPYSNFNPSSYKDDPQPTPQEALDLLLQGNVRFVHSASIHHQNHNDRRRELRDHQRPFAIILSCSDSRVPAEIIFDCGLGDLFVVRTAGHTLDKAVLGTIEFGISVLKAPLLVVLGHQNCGAVEAALHGYRQKNAHSSVIGSLLYEIYPAIDACGAETDVNRVMEANTHLTAQKILAMDSTIAARTNGSFGLVCASYSFESGLIQVLEEHL